MARSTTVAGLAVLSVVSDAVPLVVARCFLVGWYCLQSSHQTERTDVDVLTHALHLCQKNDYCVGGVVRVEATNSSWFASVAPGDLTSVLTPRARRLLREVLHSYVVTQSLHILDGLLLVRTVLLTA